MQVRKASIASVAKFSLIVTFQSERYELAELVEEIDLLAGMKLVRIPAADSQKAESRAL
jgi:hypothetical protein